MATYGTKTSRFPADYAGTNSTFAAQSELRDAPAGVDATTIEKGGDQNQLMAELDAISRKVGKTDDTGATTLTYLTTYRILRRLSQSAVPVAGDLKVNELVIWHDTDDSKTYLVIRDTDEGIRSVELL